MVEWEDIYDTPVGHVLAAIYSVAPVATSTISAFVLATVMQEFWRGTRVRQKSAKEAFPVALIMLVVKARRRYGGYIVHMGIVLMFVGYMGSAYDQEREASLRPGETIDVGAYTFRYDGVRMEQDPNKRMVFANITILRGEREVAQASPAKFIYRTHPQMPTTEVAIRSTPLQDIYLILATVDADTQRATFRIQIHPLVMWIWLGGFLLLGGVFVAIFPRVSEILQPSGAASPSRASAAASVLLALVLGGSLLAPAVASAQADGSSSLHAGTVEIHDPGERRLFERLLCDCGECQRLPLSSCGCSWAEGMRAELRGRMARGDDASAIVEDYRSRFGARSIAIPADEGLDRALWAVPVAAIVLAAVGIVIGARKWARAGNQQTEAALGAPRETDTAYDARLEDELRRFEGDDS
jgi:cytochrome c-type biogenesis protein CcmF